MRLPPLLLTIVAAARLTAQESPPPAAAGDQAGFDALATVPAAQLLPPSQLRGPGYVVDDLVATDGYLGTFLLRTDYGAFECHGREMLAVRIDETRALRELEEINKGEAFLKAAGNALAKPLEAAAGMVRDPVGTVGKMPQGIAGLFKRAGEGLQAAGTGLAREAEKARKTMDGEPVDNSPQPPSTREDPFGYNLNRNRWAAQVRADPYTSNPALAAKLSEIAAVTFATELVAGVGVGAVAAPLAWAGRVDSLVLEQPPAKVRDLVRAELLALGCPPESVESLLRNPWIPPTQLARFRTALTALRPAEGLGRAVDLAAATNSEVQIRFLCASLEGLAARLQQGTSFRELAAIAPLPAGIYPDGRLLVCAPVDVLPWLPTTRDFASRAGDHPSKLLALDGQITTTAKASLEKLGWTIGR